MSDSTAAKASDMAASFQVSAPKPFSFTRPNDWPKWSRRFERFRVASGLTEKDDKTQFNTLIYTMGDMADEILSSFGFSEESGKYDTVKGRFEGYFVKRRNVIYEWAKFNMRRQQEGEPVDEFITSLYSLIEHCHYGVLRDEMIRDRIVVGIRNTALSEKMQLQSDLDLQKAIKQAREAEASKLQQPLLRGGGEKKHDTPVAAVNKGKTWNRPKLQKNKQNTGATSHGNSIGCTRCGSHPAHDSPARDAICRKCGKRGHYQSVCRSAVVSEVESQDRDLPFDSTVSFLGAIESSLSSNPWAVRIGTPTDLHIDTGAEVTVITEQVWKKVGKPALSAPGRTLRGPDNYELPTAGKFSASFQRGSSMVNEEVYVVKGLHQSLLGRPAIEKLGVALYTR